MTPELVDGHLQMYHSYLGVNEFAEAMLTHGITTTADGFYGQGIVGVPTLSYLQNRGL